jgi:hypothetical protein
MILTDKLVPTAIAVGLYHVTLCLHQENSWLT